MEPTIIKKIIQRTNRIFPFWETPPFNFPMRIAIPARPPIMQHGTTIAYSAKDPCNPWILSKLMINIKENNHIDIPTIHANIVLAVLGLFKFMFFDANADYNQTAPMNLPHSNATVHGLVNNFVGYKPYSRLMFEITCLPSLITLIISFKSCLFVGSGKNPLFFAVSILVEKSEPSLTK